MISGASRSDVDRPFPVECRCDSAPSGGRAPRGGHDARLRRRRASQNLRPRPSWPPREGGLARAGRVRPLGGAPLGGRPRLGRQCFREGPTTDADDRRRRPSDAARRLTAADVEDDRRSATTTTFADRQRRRRPTTTTDERRRPTTGDAPSGRAASRQGQEAPWRLGRARACSREAPWRVGRVGAGPHAVRAAVGGRGQDGGARGRSSLRDWLRGLPDSLRCAARFAPIRLDPNRFATRLAWSRHPTRSDPDPTLLAPTPIRRWPVPSDRLPGSLRFATPVAPSAAPNRRNPIRHSVCPRCRSRGGGTLGPCPTVPTKPRGRT